MGGLIKMLTAYFVKNVHIQGDSVYYYRGDNISYSSNTWRGDGILITFDDERIFVPASNISQVKESR